MSMPGRRIVAKLDITICLLLFIRTVARLDDVYQHCLDPFDAAGLC